MDNKGLGAPSASQNRVTDAPHEAGKPSSPSGSVPTGAVEIDSSVYKMSFFGILNVDGKFWTPLAFDSPAAAREHIVRFWNLRAEPGYPDKAAAFLRTAKIVPVRIHLTALASDAEVRGEQALNAPLPKMPEHTPGPWIAGLHRRQWRGGREYAFVTAGSDIVPIAAITLRVEGCSHEQGDANARLIAAAPTLYTALHRIAVLVNQGAIEGLTAEAVEALAAADTACEAVAKAGKSS